MISCLERAVGHVSRVFLQLHQQYLRLHGWRAVNHLGITSAVFEMLYWLVAVHIKAQQSCLTIHCSTIVIQAFCCVLIHKFDRRSKHKTLLCLLASHVAIPVMYAKGRVTWSWQVGAILLHLSTPLLRLGPDVSPRSTGRTIVFKLPEDLY